MLSLYKSVVEQKKFEKVETEKYPISDFSSKTKYGRLFMSYLEHTPLLYQL
jgi:hypothetical protein